MVKVKNVRPGILIIADARLKLAPGEVVSLEKLTRQAEQALADGQLAEVGTHSESPRAKASVRTVVSKAEAKPEAPAKAIAPTAETEVKGHEGTNASS